MSNSDSSERYNRRKVLLGIGAGAMTAIAGCSDTDNTPTGTPTDTEDTPTATPEPTVEPSGELKENKRQVAANLYNPETVTATDITAMTMDGLYEITPEGNIFPLWADVSTGDNFVYTFELREGLYWEVDGEQIEMNADQVTWFLENVYVDRWGETDRITNITKLDEYTFSITIDEEDPEFLYNSNLGSTPIFPKEVAENDLSEQESVRKLQITGNLGAYTVTNLQPNRLAEFDRNSDYYMHDVEEFPDYISEEEELLWTNAPLFERATFNLKTDHDTDVESLLNEDINYNEFDELSKEEYGSLYSKDNLSMHMQERPYIAGLFFNQRANGWEAFTNTSEETNYGNKNASEVRKAIMKTIDKQELISQKNVSDLYESINTIYPNWTPYYDSNEGFNPEYNIEKAKSILINNLPEGYEYVEGSLMSPEDHPRWNGDQVELNYVSFGDPEVTPFSEKDDDKYIVEQLKELGISINVKRESFYDFNSSLANIDFDKHPHNTPEQSVDNIDWDFVVLGFSKLNVFTSSSIKSLLGMHTSNNFSGYVTGSEYDNLMEGISTANSPEDVREKMSELLMHISEEQPFGFLYTEHNIKVTESSMTNINTEHPRDWEHQLRKFE